MPFLAQKNSVEKGIRHATVDALFPRAFLTLSLHKTIKHASQNKASV